MPDPKLTHPLLEGFLLGDPISEHNGVRCYPAMQESTSDKYIVKTVSVPESAAKLDALLLAGAFPDRAAAVGYYQDMAEGVEKEAALLHNLSQLEGFTGYEAWQTNPDEDGECFDVCLLGKYRPTLDRYLSRNPMTHLGAVNLGLDLCSALAVCRRSGYLYVNLKPSNVFICADNEYRIGDLGFIPLASLPYASLPEKYHSAYTAPEIADAYSALNDTLDIYAAGLILYQVYNNGQLPADTAGEPLAAPEYADYEMASIILKACDPNPQERWQDPAQMGQALVNYMQRNTVNDEPIVPPAVPLEVTEKEAVEPVVDEEDPSTEDILSEVDQALEAVGVEAAEEDVPVAEASEESPAQSAEEAVEDVSDAEDEEASAEESEESVEEDAESETDGALAEMLAQADSLIAHETPEPVVAPAPIDVPIPPRIVLTEDEPEQPEDAPEASCEEEAEEIPEETDISEPAEEAQEDAEEAVLEDEHDDYPDTPVQPKRKKGYLAALISLIVVIALAVGGYLYYRYEYQQTVQSISLSGAEDRLAVVLYSQIDDELLTVVCTDAYGNTQRQNVVNGVAMFTGLSPDTRYKIEVVISGFHELLGKTSGVYVTPQETTIGSITALAGSENGSVIVNFAIRGPDSEQWQVFYTAEGEEEKVVSCSGHMATITGLTVGKNYTFRVEPTTELYVVGTNTVEFTAANIVIPENLTISGFSGGAMTVVWTAPEGADVASWTVRCYNDAGYDKTITVTETTAIFEGLERSVPYNVEVCAAGMSLNGRVSLAANSVSVQSFSADTSDPLKLKLYWAVEGDSPAGGWVVKYTVSGLAEPVFVQTNETSILIDPIIPGCTYTFELHTANEDPVFNGTFAYAAPGAEVFSGYGVTAENMHFSSCLTPNKADWDREDVAAQDYTTTFAVGQSASFVMRLSHSYVTSPDNITTLLVIRNADGSLLRTDTLNRTWTSMWYENYGTLTMPVMPAVPGTYSVEIYFNGKYVTTQGFSIV